MKVKTILVSQPRPKLENSPFLDLQKRRKLKIDFIPFIHVKGATVKEIRLQKIDLTKFSAIILTSRYAVDHYFRICEKMRFKVPDSMKYFCQSEVVALYLQNHVVYRKRKIYVGKRAFKVRCLNFLLSCKTIILPFLAQLLTLFSVNCSLGKGSKSRPVIIFNTYRLANDLPFPDPPK